MAHCGSTEAITEKLDSFSVFCDGQLRPFRGEFVGPETLRPSRQYALGRGRLFHRLSEAIRELLRKADRNSLFQSIVSLPTVGPGSVGVRCSRDL